LGFPFPIGDMYVDGDWDVGNGGESVYAVPCCFASEIIKGKKDTGVSNVGAEIHRTSEHQQEERSDCGPYCMRRSQEKM
jgi:hypothetical protein